MATHNSPYLYTGGAERFNTQPIVALYGNLLARRQAKQEALDQYYQNLHKNINPAGMRTQDINGGFNDKVSQWEKHFIENKPRISNPKTPDDRKIAVDNQSMYQDLLMDIQKSKNAAAQQLERAKLRMEGKTNDTDNDFNVDMSLNESIYSPKHYKDQGRTQPFSLNDYDTYVPQFDPKQQEEFYKAATQGLTTKPVYDEKRTRKANGQLYVPYEQSFTPDQIKTIGDRSSSLIDGSRSAKVHYERLMHDENFLFPANEAYQSVYGKDQIVDTPKKAAQAAMIMAAQKERTIGEEIRKDENAELQRQMALKNYEHALKAGDEEESNKWFDKYLNSKKQEAKQTPKALQFGVSTGWQMPMDVNLRKMFTVKVGGKDVEPNAVVLTEDDKYVPVYYQYDKNGAIEKDNKNGLPVVDYELTVPHTQNDVKVAMGGKAGVKQMNIEMGGGTTKKSTKSYSYKGKTFTPAQIEKAAKQNNMTVDEYIKQAGIK